MPVDVQTIELAQKYVRSDPNISRHDYHAKWGYGETTRFDEPQSTVGLGPQNLRIVNALPEADREAYERTLYGEDRHADFVWTLDEEDFSSTGGCTRKAVTAVFKPSQVDGTFVNPKDELIDSDKRIIEAQRASGRSACAATATTTAKTRTRSSTSTPSAWRSWPGTRTRPP